MPASAECDLPRREITRIPVAAVRVLLLNDGPINLIDDRRYQGVLNGENVGIGPIVAPGPELASRLGIQESCSDPQRGPVATNTPLDCIVDAQIRPQSRWNRAFSTVCETRGAGDDREPASPKARDEVFD
jgi:hypothetical protein